MKPFDLKMFVIRFYKCPHLVKALYLLFLFLSKYLLVFYAFTLLHPYFEDSARSEVSRRKGFQNLFQTNLDTTKKAYKKLIIVPVMTSEHNLPQLFQWCVDI